MSMSNVKRNTVLVYADMLFFSEPSKFENPCLIILTKMNFYSNVFHCATPNIKKILHWGNRWLHSFISKVPVKV